MATERKQRPDKQRPAKRRRSRTVAKITDEELTLADELLRVSRMEQADLVAGWEKFIKQLGIRGKPIGAKALRDMLLKRGFDPDNNEFSQGIVAMREAQAEGLNTFDPETQDQAALTAILGR
jgi:hypothetical protein